MTEATQTDGKVMATPDTPVAPARPKDRIASLDFIRGIAVLGILAANIVAFGQPWSAYMWPSAFLTDHGPASDWMWVAQFVIIDGKMRGLFTVLFGVGMALFMDKAWERGASRWLQVRRLGWLLLFGLLHFFFIWRGDILTLYAMAGFVAVLFLRWKPRSLMTLGILGYVVGGLVYAVTIGSAYFVTNAAIDGVPEMAEARASIDAGKQATLAEDQFEIPLMTEGTYPEFVAHNFAEHATDPFNMVFLFVFETLPLMLIGMAIYRLGWFDPDGDMGKCRKWGWILVLGGTALTIPIALWVKAGGFTYWGTISAMMAFSMIPRLPVIIGLVIILALYGQTASGWLAERLTAAGRVAFTNYVGTSVLMMLVFHPWAGGKWGEMTRPELYFVVLFGWAVMLAWSHRWLNHFRYGPLEWLWRCLTYMRLFPIRR